MYRDAGDPAVDKKMRKLLMGLLHRFPLCGLSLLGSNISLMARPIRHPVGAIDGRRIVLNTNYVLRETDTTMLEIVGASLWLHIFYNNIGRGRKFANKQLWNKVTNSLINRDTYSLWNQAAGPCSMAAVLAEELYVSADAGETYLQDRKTDLLGDCMLGDCSLRATIQKQLESRWNPPPNPVDDEDEDEVDEFDGEDEEVGEPEAKAEAEIEDHLAKAVVGGEEKDFFHMGEYPEPTPDEFFHAFTNEVLHIKVHLDTVASSKKLPAALTDRLRQITGRFGSWTHDLTGAMLEKLDEGDVISWSEPNKKHFPRLILPTVQGLGSHKMLIAVDVSGSIQRDLLQQFIGCVEAAASKAEECLILTFDAEIREVHYTKTGNDILKKMSFGSGYHNYTCCRQVFEKYYREFDPDVCVVYTDGNIQMPYSSYPSTIWCLPDLVGDSVFNPGWGKVIRMFRDTWVA